MTPQPIAFVDSGVDYITCTYNQDADFTRLGAQLLRVKNFERKQGSNVHSWKMSGYSGECQGGIEWGTRHDGSIVRLSGMTAQLYWKRFGKLASNCSRIDLQRTAVHDEPWSKTMGRTWRQMSEYYKAGKRRPKPKEIGGPMGIETVYSGNRQSDTFLRCYHRGSRKGYEWAEGHIRYEVEYKDDRASIVLGSLLRSENVDRDCASSCWTMFTSRGVHLKWAGVPLSRYRVPRKIADDRQLLAWIRKAVRPSVQHLLRVGLELEVFEALGLSDIPGDDS